MREMLKKLFRLFFGDYSIYQIYAQASENVLPSKWAMGATCKIALIDEIALNGSPNPLIREQAGYAGAGSHAYACFDGDHRIVAVCFYWFGQRYLERNFWPLAEGEAKLVQIIAVPQVRGRGIGAALIDFSCRDIMQKGFDRVYARIWHSNTPSLRAFEHAGWKRIALVLEINPFRQTRPMRIRLGSRPTPQRPAS